MKIKLTTLVENDAQLNSGLISEHGFSVFIESPHGNILFDTGQSDAFFKNAKVLGVPIETIKKIERESLRMDLPNFGPGDTVKVSVKIKEGEKERIQAFQGVVISKRKGTTNATFTVRKVSYGVGVERIFPTHSPIIDKIEIITRGRVRRAKIYYLRKLRGKAARIKEKRFN